MILGLDQSFTKSAIVVFDGEILIHHRIISTSKDMDIFERMWNISQELIKICQEYSITHVIIEGLAFGMKGNATRDLAGLQAVIICQLKYQLGINVIVVPPKSVKKYATSNGKADKNSMIDALPLDILERFKSDGYKKTTGLSDLADSFWIVKTGMSILNF